MNAALKKAANQLNILLHEGVYCAVDGPSLETRAEYRYLRQIGGDVVGMSTVPEVIVANQMELPCAVVSVVTDECDPDNLKPVSIQEMIAAATTAETKLVKLFETVIENNFD
jgi:purine-nucleoside phosphorylase